MGAPLKSKAPLFTSSAHGVGASGRGGDICADSARFALVPSPSDDAVVATALTPGTMRASKANLTHWLR